MIRKCKDRYQAVRLNIIGKGLRWFLKDTVLGTFIGDSSNDEAYINKKVSEYMHKDGNKYVYEDLELAVSVQSLDIVVTEYYYLPAYKSKGSNWRFGKAEVTSKEAMLQLKKGTEDAYETRVLKFKMPLIP